MHSEQWAADEKHRAHVSRTSLDIRGEDYIVSGVVVHRQIHTTRSVLVSRTTYIVKYWNQVECSTRRHISLKSHTEQPHIHITPLLPFETVLYETLLYFTFRNVPYQNRWLSQEAIYSYLKLLCIMIIKGLVSLTYSWSIQQEQRIPRNWFCRKVSSVISLMTNLSLF